MKKVDFTIKGTKLPVIPVGTLFNVVDTGNTWGNISHEYKGFVSFGSNSPDEIVADDEGYDRKFFYIFKLSDIERLAEEQGMLYEKETERDWTGVRFKVKYDSKINEIIKFSDRYRVKGWHYSLIDGMANSQEQINNYFSNGTWIEVKEEPKPERDYNGVMFRYKGEVFVWELKKRSEGYGIVGVSLPSIISVDKIVSNFADGTWIEVKDEQQPIISQPNPSLQSLLQRATVAEYHIRTGCQMFIGVDEVERLEQMKACERELKEAILQLNNILN